MNRETVRLRTSSSSIGVADGHVASLRTTDTLETAVRMYAGGHVGIASAVGPTDEDALAAAATEALALEIPHAPGPVRDSTSDTSRGGDLPEGDALVAEVEALLAPLRKRFPTFVYSNRVTAQRTELTVENDVGTRHRYAATEVGVGLILKERGSPHIMDGVILCEADAFDPAGMFEATAPWLEAWDRKAAFTPGRHTVVFRGLSDLGGRFHSELVGRRLATGASMFAAKLGERVFSDRFTLIDSRDARKHRVCPFDLEGTLRSYPDLALIQSGVVKGGVASRREAARYGVPATGNATGPLKGLPLGACAVLHPAATAPRLADLLDGPAILVDLSAGGDGSEAGDVGLPVQLGWWIDREGRPLGRLPEIMLSGNLYRLFGDDYVGTTTERVGPFRDEPFVVVKMDAHPAHS
jgi:PmbA protein